MNVVVIGAGIVGMTAARWLQRDGHAVTVVDPAPPGTGASMGNAGCFSPSSIVPLSGPGTLRQVPGWLRDPAGPLALRWRYLPRAAPWLVRFIKAGRGERVAAQAAALSRLLAPVHESLRTLLGEGGAAELTRQDGSLIVYRTEAGWRGGQAGWALRRANGIVWEELDGDGLHALDPGLAPGLFRGVKLPGNGHTIDPYALVCRLADAFACDGGRFVRAPATGFDLAGDRLRAVRTGAGPELADVAVLAAGAYSKPLARQLGDRLPLETERGYHLTVQQPEVMPRLPTLHAEDRFVLTPMAAGLRLTGTVELAGLRAPEGAAEHSAVWMGHRPSMPDSLPVIGRSRRCADVVYAFGHGHLGLTGAPFTGRLVAELVGGRPPAIDLRPYAPARFA
jgi:D-amino-acid dehydrogenase